MNPGDLVTVLYEAKRYYLVIGSLGRDCAGEARVELLDIISGNMRYVFQSEVKVVSEGR
jgi:hypothetical protein